MGLQLVARSTLGSELCDSKIGDRGRSLITIKFGALLKGTTTAVLRLWPRSDEFSSRPYSLNTNTSASYSGIGCPQCGQSFYSSAFATISSADISPRKLKSVKSSLGLISTLRRESFGGIGGLALRRGVAYFFFAVVFAAFKLGFDNGRKVDLAVCGTDE